MVDDGETRKPPGVKNILKWQKQDQKRRESNKGKRKGRPKIHGHLDVGQTIKEENARKRKHPAGHKRPGLPAGTTTSGPKPPTPEEATN